MYTVYLRTNVVNGKQYVGQTGNFRKRQNHWNCLTQHYANNFFTQERNEYGLENFKTEILAEVETQEEAWELEEHYIKELNTKYPNGYNKADGGKTNKGSIDGENNPNWGKPRSEETKRKIGEAQKGEKNHCYGEPKTEEWKEKVSKKNKNSLKCGSKPVLQIDKNTNEVIAEFPSMAEVERQFGFSFKNISCCCRGIIKSAYGFKWKYKKVS